jgi:hypothetical protein
METPNLFELSIDGASSGFLNETSRWAKFLAIVGFVMVGFMILFSLAIIGLGNSNPMMQASFQSAGYSNPAVLGIVYLVMAVVSIFPYLYLFQFATKMKAALSSSEQDVLNSAFSSLKSCFKFVGVFTIILLGFFVLAFAIGIVAMMTAGV